MSCKRRHRVKTHTHTHSHTPTALTQDSHTVQGPGWTGPGVMDRTCEAAEDTKWIWTGPDNPEWTALLHTQPTRWSAGRRQHHLRTHTCYCCSVTREHPHPALRPLPCRSGPRQVIRPCRQRPRLWCTSGWVGGADNSRLSTKVKVGSARARNTPPQRSMMRARLWRAQVWDTHTGSEIKQE